MRLFVKKSQCMITKVKPLKDMMLIATFSNGEQRLYDAMQLLKLRNAELLKREAIFNQAKVENGMVTWADGKIKVSSKTIYDTGYDFKE